MHNVILQVARRSFEYVDDVLVYYTLTIREKTTATQQRTFACRYNYTGP